MLVVCLAACLLGLEAPSSDRIERNAEAFVFEPDERVFFSGATRSHWAAIYSATTIFLRRWFLATALHVRHLDEHLEAG